MEAHVLHIGVDDCHRVAVLRSVGYRVDECATLPHLIRALKGANGTDAVFVTESEDVSQEKAISLAREHSAAPMILFQKSNHETPYQEFDLVIEPLTSPSKWLQEVRSLVECSRLLRARARLPDSMWSMPKTRILQRDLFRGRIRESDRSFLRFGNSHPSGH